MIGADFDITLDFSESIDSLIWISAMAFANPESQSRVDIPFVTTEEDENIEETNTPLDIWKVVSNMFLARYFILEERRGKQLLSRFYTEANIRILANRHDPPFQFTTPSIINTEPADFLIPFDFSVGLVSEDIKTYDRFPRGSTFMGDVLKFDTILYLGMQWIFNPSIDLDFFPIFPLTRDLDFMDLVNRSIGQPEAQSVVLKARFLKGSPNSNVIGRIDAFQILSRLYASLLKHKKPMLGANLIENIFTAMIPNSFSSEKKTEWWKYTTTIFFTIFKDWNTQYLELENQKDSVRKEIMKFIQQVRIGFSAYRDADDDFPNNTVWSLDKWSVLAVYENSVPEIGSTKELFDSFVNQYGNTIATAVNNEAPVPLELLNSVNGYTFPNDWEYEGSTFFTNSIGRDLFVCTCLFMYIRFIESGFVLPYTGNLKSIRNSVKRESPKISIPEIDKLTAFTTYCVHRAFQNGYTESFSKMLVNSFPNYRYMIGDSGGSTKDIIQALLTRWRLLLLNASGAEKRKKIEENIRLLSASILRLESVMFKSSELTENDVEDIIQKTKHIVIK